MTRTLGSDLCDYVITDADVDKDVISTDVRVDKPKAFWKLNHLTVPLTR